MVYKFSGTMLEKGFTVPNDIVDKHLRLVGGEQIKVLLLLLRHPGKDMSVSYIAGKLKLSEEEVEDCLQYWFLTGVISETEESIGGEKPEEGDAPQKYVPKAAKPEATPAPPPPAVEYSRPGPAEIATRISESKEISDMFEDLQKILGRTIGYDGQCTFLLLHDRFVLPPEVI
jgi:hypothetical protein